MLTWRLLALLGLLVVVAIAGHACAEPAAPPAPSPPGASAQQSTAPAVAAPEARAHAREVLAEIERRHGEPPPGYVGGRRFANRERRLSRGAYREYDVHPKIPGRDRGPERIVIEQRTGKAWYTGDHYRTFVPLN
jgi:guanyl-specific ribonuclease Sa